MLVLARPSILLRRTSISSYSSVWKGRNLSERSEEESCRIVFISDTHSVHKRLGLLPGGDILVHAGDFTRSRPAKPEEYKEFSDWLVAQPHSHKVLISGNRDQLMDTAAKHEPCERFWMRQMQ